MHNPNEANTRKQLIAPAENIAAQQALETDRTKLAELHARIAPLQDEINQLTRQFWVTKSQLTANKYDLSASRYRLIEQDEIYYEQPETTLERLLKLEQVMSKEILELESLLK